MQKLSLPSENVSLSITGMLLCLIVEVLVDCLVTVLFDVNRVAATLDISFKKKPNHVLELCLSAKKFQS